MHRAGITLVVVVLLALSAGAAETVSLNEGVDVLSVALAEAGPDRTVIEYRLGGFTLEDIEIDGRRYQTVTLGGESGLLEKGLPGLPNVCRSIAIPDDARMSVRVVSSQYTDFEGIDVAPSKGSIPRNIDPATVAYEFDAFYGRNEWYPSDLAYAREPYILRDVRGTVVVINPFQYNPATHVLRVYDRVTVEVVRSGPGEVNVLTRRPPGGIVPEFARLYDRHFLNWPQGTNLRYTPVDEVGRMLVVAHESFMTAMEPFVEWKSQMGVPCEMVSVTDAGGTSSGIESYIQTYYDTYGLAFVLLVGDAAQVPSPGAYGGSSDPSYSLVAGGDTYPDIFVGRFSAETVAHVETQVLRSVEYEKLPAIGADWYHKGTGIASDLGPGDDNEYDDEHMDNIRTDLLGFTYTEVDRIYDPTANPTMVSTALNDGRSIVNYVGHGSTMGWGSSDFNSSHVNALTNDNMLPFIWSVACLNGRFDGLTCFAEVWLRATNGTEPTGAIGAYMSSINQDWDEPMDAQDEMVDLLVAEEKRTFGGLAVNGSCHMLDEYGANGDDEILTWHVFGDPSLRVRTDTPVALDVAHADEVSPGATTFDVTVVGVEGALCALYYDGVLYGSGFTGAGGTATIDVTEVLPADQDVVVTVTAFNAVPYFGTVHVGLAFTPIIDVSPAFFDVTMEPGESRSDTMTVDNVGEPQSVLHFDIEVVDAGMGRDLNTSEVAVTPTSYEPGTTFDLLFELYNGSSDDEWVNGASLDFPSGVTVNSCTGFTVSDRTLVCDGASGDGAYVTWTGDWWNVVYPAESAYATVNVTIDGGFTGNIDVLYGIEGDGYGDPPHSLSGTVTIEGPSGPVAVTLTSPNGDEVWGIGEEHEITWEPTGLPLLVDILCSGNGGADWSTVLGATDDDGSHLWNVDTSVSDNCLVKVCLTNDPEINDVSDSSFSIYQPVEWLTVTPSSGEVTVGSRASIGVTFDSAGMDEGDYYADIIVTSNGGDPVTLPVALHLSSTGVDDRIPKTAVLYGNYPNPFGPATNIGFSVPGSMEVTITIYTASGRRVRTLVDDMYRAGRYSVPWDGRSGSGREMPNGMYFYRLEAGSTALSGKMTLMR